MSLRIFTLAAVLFAIVPSTLAAQSGRLRPVSDGDGRIHGAPTMPVSEMDLHPGQVQTLNLHPRYHAVIEFPFPVAQVDAGDPDVFSASIVGNKLTLSANRVRKAETSMSVMLGDANLTVVPFLVRADSTQPFVYIVRYTDPVAKHLNAAESQIADRLQADVDERVAELSEQRLQQRLLLAGDLVRIGKRTSVGSAGERLTLVVESAQQIPSADGNPRLYVRYRILNQTIAPLEDLVITPRIVTTRRRWLFFTRTEVLDVYDVQDVRTSAAIPPGTAASGLLIFDSFDLQSSRESLTLEATAFNGQRVVVVDRVLVGEDG